MIRSTDLWKRRIRPRLAAALERLGGRFARYGWIHAADRSFAASLRLDPASVTARLARRRLPIVRWLEAGEEKILLEALRSNRGLEARPRISAYRSITRGWALSTELLTRVSIDCRGEAGPLDAVCKLVVAPGEVPPREYRVMQAAQSLPDALIAVPRLHAACPLGAQRYAMLLDWIETREIQAGQGIKARSLGALAVLRRNACPQLFELIEADPVPIEPLTHADVLALESLVDADMFAALEERIREAEELCAQQGIAWAELPLRLAHGDAHDGNLIADLRGGTTMLDLQMMCLAPAGFDLASLIGFRARHNQRLRRRIRKAEMEAAEAFRSGGGDRIAPAEIWRGYALGALHLGTGAARRVVQRHRNPKQQDGLTTAQFCRREAGTLGIYLGMAVRALGRLPNSCSLVAMAHAVGV